MQISLPPKATGRSKLPECSIDYSASQLPGSDNWLYADPIYPDASLHLTYAVLTSASPAEAINMARKHSGEIRPDIRTLFMSGYTANVIAHHGVLDDGVAFNEKPFTFENLARKVGEAIDSEERRMKSKNVKETRNAASGP